MRTNSEYAYTTRMYSDIELSLFRCSALPVFDTEFIYWQYLICTTNIQPWVDLLTVPYHQYSALSWSTEGTLSLP